jgi:hypothetical protein
MGDYSTSSVLVKKAVQDHLNLLQMRDVDISALLDEISQWYGLLIPADAHGWEFVHRTIHDFLAAKHLVENGLFNPTSIRAWDMRTAYAACMLSHDATPVLTRMVEKADTMAPFVECLYNRAPFNPALVAGSVLKRMESHPCKPSVEFDSDGAIATIPEEEDFYGSASLDFLGALAERASGQVGVAEIVGYYAVSEILKRGNLQLARRYRFAPKRLGIRSDPINVRRRTGWLTFKVGDVV